MSDSTLISQTSRNRLIKPPTYSVIFGLLMVVVSTKANSEYLGDVLDRGRYLERHPGGVIGNEHCKRDNDDPSEVLDPAEDGYQGYDPCCLDPDLPVCGRTDPIDNNIID